MIARRTGSGIRIIENLGRVAYPKKAGTGRKRPDREKPIAEAYSWVPTNVKPAESTTVEESSHASCNDVGGVVQKSRRVHGQKRNSSTSRRGSDARRRGVPRLHYS